jgi:hypothetical protein
MFQVRAQSAPDSQKRSAFAHGLHIALEVKGMKFLLLALLFFSLAPTDVFAEECMLDSQVAGKYAMQKLKGYLPSTLSVTSTDDTSKFEFDLEAYSSSRPNDDGSQTSQSIFHGKFDFRSCVGLYFDPEDQCFFVFDFSKTQVKVVNFGSCYFGHGAYPGGNYVRVGAGTSNKPLQPIAPKNGAPVER